MEGIMFSDPSSALLGLSKLSLKENPAVGQHVMSRKIFPPAPRGPRRAFGRHAVPSHSSSAIISSYSRADLPTAATPMAEVDTRPGGGRGNYNNNRKRRFREDDHNDRRPQRRRHEEPVASRLRRQMLAIAESPMRDARDETSDIARLLVDNLDDERVREGFLELVVMLALEQPFKIPFVAAVVLYANDEKSTVAQEILSQVGGRAQAAARTGNWREFKLLLRLLACLQVILEGEGVFPILDELFNNAVELQTASSEDAVGLELVKIILLTIPYLLVSSSAGLEQRALDLLEKTDIIASTPHALETIVEPYPGNGEEKPVATQSMLGLLQRQMHNESTSGWQFACIPRLYKPKAVENGNEGQAGVAKHVAPTIVIPSPVNPGPRPLFPEAYFSLYADQEIETVPKTSDIAASLIRDALVDTINVLDFNRTATARFLIDLDCYWAPDTFVKRATPYDRLRDLAGDKSTWKPEDLAVDAVFSQIVQLPSPEHKLVYYHSVITESCKIAPAAIAPSLGRAIRYLFRNLDMMDMELGYRFMDWFAHHLSNFDFRWKWTEWVEDIDRSDIHPKKAFMVGALDKEIRLSFAKRIRETLPEPYHPLIPKGKEKDTPDFKYASDDTPYAAEGRELVTLIRKKASEEDIQPVIDRIHSQAAAHNVPDVLVPSTDAYVTCICFIGSKSLSHVLSYIDRCKERLLAAGAQSAAARAQIIASVVSYWADMPGIAVNIIDKLLNYSILTPLAVVYWALGPDNLGSGATLSLPWRFEMITATVAKVSARVRQIVAARCQPALPPDQVPVLDDTLVRERAAMRELLKVIEDAVVGVTEGASDGFMEAQARGLLSDEDVRLIRAWGERWTRVFRRKAVVEEAVVGELAVAMRLQALEAEAALAAESAAAADADAASAGAGAGAGTAAMNGQMDAEMQDQGYDGVE